MRRLGHFILNGLTALSLLLCAAALMLWARNARHGPPWDEVYRVRATCSYGVGMEAGRVIAYLQRQGPAYREGTRATSTSVAAGCGTSA